MGTWMASLVLDSSGALVDYCNEVIGWTVKNSLTILELSFSEEHLETSGEIQVLIFLVPDFVFRLLYLAA